MVNSGNEGFVTGTVTGLRPLGTDAVGVDLQPPLRKIRLAERLGASVDICYLHGWISREPISREVPFRPPDKKCAVLRDFSFNRAGIATIRARAQIDRLSCKLINRGATLNDVPFQQFARAFDRNFVERDAPPRKSPRLIATFSMEIPPLNI